MIKFHEWLQQKEGQTKLAIFDFDKTLAYTAEKPKGWKGEDWFSNPESLEGDNFGGFNPHVLSAFQAAKKDPNTHAVMLTGRRSSISPTVRQIFQNHGLFGKRTFPQRHPGNAFFIGHPNEEKPDAHSEFYKGDYDKESDYPRYPRTGQPVQEVELWKTYIIEKLITPNITTIDLYEDKPENIAAFKKTIKQIYAKWPNVQFVKIHWVKPQSIETIPVDRD
jgi:hypothetical protein